MFRICNNSMILSILIHEFLKIFCSLEWLVNGKFVIIKIIITYVSQPVDFHKARDIFFEFFSEFSNADGYEYKV